MRVTVLVVILSRSVISVAQMDLLAACKAGKSEEALRLLAEGVDPKKSNRRGETPLHWAAINCDLTLAVALLAAGANPNGSTRSKHAIGSGAGNATPLHFAASRRSLEVIDCLLEAGADPRAVDSAGVSVLHSAVYSPEIRVLRTLIHAGADPNDGSLTLAVRDRDIEVVRELLSLGASPNGDGGDGFSPLRMAYACNKSDVATVLLEAGARWPDEETQR